MAFQHLLLFSVLIVLVIGKVDPLLIGFRVLSLCALLHFHHELLADLRILVAGHTGEGGSEFPPFPLFCFHFWAILLVESIMYIINSNVHLHILLTTKDFDDISA